MSEDEQLVKIAVNTPEGGWCERERLWSKALGGDLYELRNSPVYTKDFHFGDVVRAVSDGDYEFPIVVELVQRGGHRTILVGFPPSAEESERIEKLRQLHRWGAHFEHGLEGLYAVDIAPDGDFDAVCEQVRAWQESGLVISDVDDRC